MKIGCFAMCMGIGGAEKVASQLIGVWKDLGHETILITSMPPMDCEYECYYSGREVLKREMWGSVESIAKLHERHHVDLIIFNGGVSCRGFGEVIDWLHLRGVRVVMILHHTANNWMYTLGSSEDLWADDAWRKLDSVVCVNKMWALWWKHRGVKSVFIQNPVSVRGMRDERGGMRDEKSALMGNLNPQPPSPIPHLSPLTLVNNVEEAVEKLKGKRNIIWVGRLNDPLKRPELAIEVFARLAKEGMRDGERGMRDEIGGMRFTMLGACSKATEKRLRRLFSSLISRFHSPTIPSSSPIPHPPSLTFPGFVKNVGDYLAKADAHLFTSATEVTVPQVILEANVAGVPTVAFDIPVLRDEGWEMRDEKGGIGDEMKEKWRKVLDGETVECDFDSPDVYQRLMDELQFSQQWFASHYLPTLHALRRLKLRLNPQYLMSRLVVKLFNHKPLFTNH